jgi:hypothetical protein
MKTPGLHTNSAFQAVSFQPVRSIYVDLAGDRYATSQVQVVIDVVVFPDHTSNGWRCRRVGYLVAMLRCTSSLVISSTSKFLPQSASIALPL